MVASAPARSTSAQSSAAGPRARPITPPRTARSSPSPSAWRPRPRTCSTPWPAPRSSCAPPQSSGISLAEEPTAGARVPLARVGGRVRAARRHRAAGRREPMRRGRGPRRARAARAPRAPLHRARRLAPAASPRRCSCRSWSRTRCRAPCGSSRTASRATSTRGRAAAREPGALRVARAADRSRCATRSGRSKPGERAALPRVHAAPARPRLDQGPRRPLRVRERCRGSRRSSRPRAELIGRRRRRRSSRPRSPRSSAENDATRWNASSGIETIETLEHADGVHHSIVAQVPDPGHGRRARARRRRGDRHHRASAGRGGAARERGALPRDGRQLAGDHLHHAARRLLHVPLVAWTQLTGRAIEHGLGFGWGNAVHPDDLEHTRAVFAPKEVPTPFRVEFAPGARRRRIPLGDRLRRAASGPLGRVSRLRRLGARRRQGEAHGGGAARRRPPQGRVPRDARARAAQPARADPQLAARAARSRPTPPQPSACTR